MTMRQGSFTSYSSDQSLEASFESPSQAKIRHLEAMLKTAKINSEALEARKLEATTIPSGNSVDGGDIISAVQKNRSFDDDDIMLAVHRIDVVNRMSIDKTDILSTIRGKQGTGISSKNLTRARRRPVKMHSAQPPPVSVPRSSVILEGSSSFSSGRSTMPDLQKYVQNLPVVIPLSPVTIVESYASKHSSASEETYVSIMEEVISASTSQESKSSLNASSSHSSWSSETCESSSDEMVLVGEYDDDVWVPIRVSRKKPPKALKRNFPVHGKRAKKPERQRIQAKRTSFPTEVEIHRPEEVRRPREPRGKVLDESRKGKKHGRLNEMGKYSEPTLQLRESEKPLQAREREKPVRSVDEDRRLETPDPFDVKTDLQIRDAKRRQEAVIESSRPREVKKPHQPQDLKSSQRREVTKSSQRRGEERQRETRERRERKQATISETRELRTALHSRYLLVRVPERLEVNNLNNPGVVDRLRKPRGVIAHHVREIATQTPVESHTTSERQYVSGKQLEKQERAKTSRPNEAKRTRESRRASPPQTREIATQTLGKVRPLHDVDIPRQHGEATRQLPTKEGYFSSQSRENASQTLAKVQPFLPRNAAKEKQPRETKEASRRHVGRRSFRSRDGGSLRQRKEYARSSRRREYSRSSDGSEFPRSSRRHHRSRRREAKRPRYQQESERKKPESRIPPPTHHRDIIFSIVEETMKKLLKPPEVKPPVQLPVMNWSWSWKGRGSSPQSRSSLSSRSRERRKLSRPAHRSDQQERESRHPTMAPRTTDFQNDLLAVVGDTLKILTRAPVATTPSALEKNWSWSSHSRDSSLHSRSTTSFQSTQQGQDLKKPLQRQQREANRPRQLHHPKIAPLATDSQDDVLAIVDDTLKKLSTSPEANTPSRAPEMHRSTSSSQNRTSSTPSKISTSSKSESHSEPESESSSDEEQPSVEFAFESHTWQAPQFDGLKFPVTAADATTLNAYQASPSARRASGSTSSRTSCGSSTGVETTAMRLTSGMPSTIIQDNASMGPVGPDGVRLSQDNVKIYSSVRCEEYLKAAELAYQKVLEVRPRVKFLFSQSEWRHVHTLLLYARVWDCELSAAGIPTQDQFRIEIPNNIQILAPLAAVLRSIGIVHDKGLGVTYIPVARQLLENQPYRHPRPADVTEFLEWTQYDWNASWMLVEAERKARQRAASEAKINPPDPLPPSERQHGSNVADWQNQAVGLWLRYDADLWFSYQQVSSILSRRASFVPFPTNPSGTYAWLIPRAESSDNVDAEIARPACRLPKQTLPKDDWVIGLLFNLSALPWERTCTWYHRIQAAKPAREIMDQFIGSAIL
jgi:hypothetical protein